MKARKIAIEVECFQYDGNLKDSKGNYYVPDWAVKAFEEGVLYYERIVLDGISEIDGALVIRTLEGDMVVSASDYVIKGVKGELYPCRKDIFEMTYNIVKEDNDKDYSGYGFYWNAEERTLVVNGKKEKHVTKATITLAPNMAAKVEVEKLLTAPIVDVQDTVNVKVSHIYPYMND